MRVLFFGAILLLVMFLTYLSWLRYCQWVRRFDKGKAE